MFSTWHGLCRFYKGLTRRRAFDKMLRDEAFNIARNPKYDGYQRSIASMIIFLVKNLLVAVLKMRIYQTKS